MPNCLSLPHDIFSYLLEYRHRGLPSIPRTPQVLPHFIAFVFFFCSWPDLTLLTLRSQLKQHQFIWRVILHILYHSTCLTPS